MLHFSFVILTTTVFVDVSHAVLQRFSCTEYGRSTQTCKMSCNYDGSCMEKLRIVSCNCDGYGKETLQKNFYQVYFLQSFNSKLHIQTTQIVKYISWGKYFIANTERRRSKLCEASKIAIFSVCQETCIGWIHNCLR